MTVVSNLFLLIPFAGAWWFRLWTRSWIFFWMTLSSFTYHLCDSFGACIFSFSVHHHLDFFFAQLLIALTALYLIVFSPKYPWLERGLIIFGAIVIIILQVTLDAELYVQAAIVGAAFVGIIIYWVAEGVPQYRWDAFLLGFSLIAGSVLLYTSQNLLPSAYWGIHSLWHTAAALGQYFFLFIKPRGRKYAALDAKIH